VLKRIYSAALMSAMVIGVLAATPLGLLVATLAAGAKTIQVCARAGWALTTLD
jgi:hypothetical protein